MGLRPVFLGPRTPGANMGHPSRGWGLAVKGDFSYVITVQWLGLAVKGDFSYVITVQWLGLAVKGDFSYVITVQWLGLAVKGDFSYVITVQWLGLAVFSYVITVQWSWALSMSQRVPANTSGPAASIITSLPAISISAQAAPITSPSACTAIAGR